MNIHLKTLGCRLNEAELETWSREFHQFGHDMTLTPDNADIIVINTCAVTEEAVKKSKKLLRKSHRDNPDAKLVISGCYASLSPDETLSIEGVDLVVPNMEKSQLVSIIHEKLGIEADRQNETADSNQLLFSGRQRAFIKVQDGCRYRCTFCIVTVARGQESSRSIEEIVNEINFLVSQDIKEVVITGVHLGGYGQDRGTNLVDLVQAILEATGIERIRMGSLEPWELSEGFWELFDNPRVMPHLHLPLQSGADSVLRRMARRCKTPDFEQLLYKARQVQPDFNITTDIIVGFPGETEEEWQQSLAFIERMNFGHVHIFAYSPREGTKAATLPNPVSRELKRQRSDILHQVAEKMKHNNLKMLFNKTAEVLFEGNQTLNMDGKITWSGYTPNFQRIRVKTTRNDLCNQILKVKISNQIEDNILLADLVDE